MESYIKISNLNDFVFCPVSIYFHNLYGYLKEELYQTDKQKNGKDAHEAIDNRHYSTHKDVLQGIDVYSEKYKLCGKIDIFDIGKGLLTERKKHISVVYDGYVFQLYAQYFAMIEMGYDVRRLRFYSSDDNKIYPVKLPGEDEGMFDKFERLIGDMRAFDIDGYVPQDKDKCVNCIYSDFCDRTLACDDDCVARSGGPVS